MGATFARGSRQILALLAAAVLVVVGLVPLYLRWIARYPFFAALTALLLALMTGLVGRAFGIRDLFWRGTPSVVVGASVAALAVLLVILGFLLEEDPAALAGRCARVPGLSPAAARVLGLAPTDPHVPAEPAAQLRVVLRVMLLPAGVLLLLAFLPGFGGAGNMVGSRTAPNPWGLLLGAGLVLLAAELALRVVPVRAGERWQGVAAALVVVALALLLSRRSAVTALIAVAAGLALVAYLTYHHNLLRLGLLAALLLGMALANGLPYKLSYPGLEAYRPAPGDPRAAKKTGTLVTLSSLRRDYLGGQAERSGWKVYSPSEEAYTRGQAECSDEEVLNATYAGTRELAELVDSGRPQRAITCYDAAEKQDADYIPALWSRALLHQAIYFRATEFSDGEVAPEKALSLKREALEAAIRDFELIRHQGGDSAGVLFGMGLFRERLEDERKGPPESYAEAERLFAQAVALDSLHVRARKHLAVVAENRGDKAGAEEQYQRAAWDMAILAHAGVLEQVDVPDDLEVARAVQPLYNEALALSRAGKLDAAQPKFLEALQKASSWFTYGYSVVTPQGLLDDAIVLDRWLVARAPRPELPLTPENRPRLVVVAVSGGGIVAAAWTMDCLTAIEERFPAFPYHVRIITGASGGMVGAGYYVATLKDAAIDLRTHAASLPPGSEAGGPHTVPRAELRARIGRDCLEPVVRCLLFHDLPALFWPFALADDRGRALEQVWSDPEHTDGVLSRTFADLRRGEAEGWRPSLIVTPLLVEDGAQMAISNLELEHLDGINLHFFPTFPRARARFQLGTALRMNAAFPFVSPAVALPTLPPRRIADAGYVDNYGVRLATEWIRYHREWLAEHSSGVALVEIRAYRLDLPGQADAARPAPIADGPGAGRPTYPPRPRLATSLQGLTSPMEGYTAAKKTAMVTLNERLVRELGESFEPGFFRHFVLECDEEIPLSWNLAPESKQRLETKLRAVAPVLDRLTRFLEGE